MNMSYQFSSNNLYTGVGKIRFTVVRMEKDTQVVIIKIVLLTQKNVTMTQCT